MIPERAVTHDPAAEQGFLYALALHSQPGSGVSLHGWSFPGARYRVLLTTAGDGARARFFEGVNRDVAGYLAELHGWGACRFEIDEVQPLDDVEATVAAAALLAGESGVVCV